MNYSAPVKQAKEQSPANNAMAAYCNIRPATGASGNGGSGGAGGIVSAGASLLLRGWQLIDPASGPDGDGLIVSPGFCDLHVLLRGRFTVRDGQAAG